MNTCKQPVASALRSTKGFTLVELIVVVAIMATLIGMAAPAFIQWRRGMEYRTVTRNIASTLREARSRAISTNREQRVTFDVVNRRFQMTQCTAPTNNALSNCGEVILGWTTLPPSVNMAVNSNNILFNPNGAARFDPPGPTTGTINIQDATPITRFDVDVTQTGRIQITLRN